ncbi:MAG TPA: hypothetical protein VKE74_20885 [Gemmataceae bacterium]|nr:hypothetical protein [Gemmataceae bacterium]
MSSTRASKQASEPNGRTSQPFDPPKSGKIAVKVINHFGDEVLKVYPVPKKGNGKA